MPIKAIWTKAEEIEWLDEAIKWLGPSSYLGPWLAENRGRIVQDLTSDFAPTIMLPGEAYRKGTEMLRETKAECAALLEAARAKADKDVKDAHDRITEYKERARAELRALADRITR